MIVEYFRLFLIIVYNLFSSVISKQDIDCSVILAVLLTARHVATSSKTAQKGIPV